MLNFHGMPFRNATAIVREENDCHIEKRIVHVIPVSEIIETPVSTREFAPPIRTQLVKVAFADGTTRMGCVTL